jgi:hypothetical protein
VRRINLIIIVICAATTPVAAQWHRGRPIDKVITAADLEMWTENHGAQYVNVNDDAIVVTNPYDHPSTARVAFYRTIDLHVRLFHGTRETPFPLYALNHIEGDKNAARADPGDQLRGVLIDLQAFLVTSPLLIVICVVLLAIVVAAQLLFASPRRLRTGSLCDEVERRFLAGARR